MNRLSEEAAEKALSTIESHADKYSLGIIFMSVIGVIGTLIIIYFKRDDNTSELAALLGILGPSISVLITLLVKKNIVIRKARNLQLIELIKKIPDKD